MNEESNKPLCSLLPLAALLFMIVLTGCSSRVSATAYSTSNSGGFPGGQALYYSSTAPTAAVPSLTDGDSFDGWVSFNSGLTIPQGANITLNTVGIFGGALNFGNAHSTLTLSQDLQCRSDFSITGTAGGRITGNGYVIKLAGDLTINYPLTATNFTTLTIDGQGHRLTLNCASAIASVGTINLQNMDLVLASANAFLSGGSTIINLQNVNLFMGGDQGTNFLTTAGHVALYGSGYTFRCNNPYTINNNSTFYVGPGVTLGFQTTGGVTLGGAAATLALDGCTLDAVSWGAVNVPITGGMVTLSNQVLIKVTGRTLTFGDGTAPNNTKVEVNSGAYVIVDGTLYHHPS